MPIDIIVSAILTWCSTSDPKYSKAAKQDCVETVANCIIDYKGEVIVEPKVVEKCKKEGQKWLK